MTLKRWEIRIPNPTLREELAEALHLHPVTAQLLIHRGVETASQARAFLSHDLSSCHDPFNLKDMEKAVGRLKRALKEKEKVLVWGDYDVDGVTSTSLLVRSLNAFGFHTLHHIPNRLTDGYGLNKTFLTLAKKKGVAVIISVDTGIAGHEAVAHLKELGMDIILTDHHEPKRELPKAYAIINPLQKGCAYPFRFLSGVGLAYKLASAVAKTVLPEMEEKIQAHLDLVAVGTVADVVPMIGENRILVHHGLRMLEKRQKPGLRALLSLGGIRRQTLIPRDIGFIVAPRINASGRLGSAEISLKLLLTDDEEEAGRLSQQLEVGNKNRRRIETQMLKEAIAKVEREINFKHERVIVLQDERWHPGVVGIIASRILNRFYRPTIVIAVTGGIGRGSARSIQGFPLPAALDQCKEYLDEFGGHKFACGVTLREENIQPFRESINRIASQTLDAEDLVPTLLVDMEIPLGTLQASLLEEFKQLQPFGPGNPEPLFLSKRLLLRNCFKQGGEVRGEVSERKGDLSFEATLSSQLAREVTPFLDQPIDLVYHPVHKKNEERGTPCLHIKDFAPSRLVPAGS
ncbi:MAG: single-stranded-DNA-specific exonuclease RecJ [Candidatus Omnitrophica bacterium]|nr:single-stranded-DNA-specific exonuclease RecJ [Candidatus Omnitrophota bacterium]